MRKNLLIAAAGCGMIMWGCNPKPNQSDLVKRLVVTTDYNGSANFNNYSTYTMVLDTISYFDNSDPNPADTSAIGSAVQSITSEVKTKLDLAGYNLVNKNASPDLWVYIYVNQVYSAYQSYYYNPYSYGYYGYGSYYPTVSVTDQADLFIFIIDLKHKTSGPYVWACDIGDLVSSSESLLDAIDQAFTQSSYLKKQ